MDGAMLTAADKVDAGENSERLRPLPGAPDVGFERTTPGMKDTPF
jgi:hypothetical protein